MMSTANTYLDLAQSALRILGVKYNSKKELPALLDTLEHSLPFAASQTELSIQEITKNLANAIRRRDDKAVIENLIEKLRDEVEFAKMD